LKLDHLKTFQRVAHSGSFTRAAQELFITQPTVTQHIQSLEHEFGTQLLVRTKQSSYLTPEGKHLLRTADAVFRMLDEVSDAFRNRETRVGGELKLAASTVMGNYFLPEILAAFIEKYPAVQLSMTYGNSWNIASWVQEGLVDFGFAPPVSGFPHLNFLPLHTERCAFAVGMKHPLAGREAFEPEELSGAPFIVREKGTSIFSVTERWIHRHVWKEDPPAFMTFTDMQTIKKIVACNVGITLLPECTLQFESQLGLLHLIRLDESLCVSYALVYRQNLACSDLRSIFMAFLCQRLAASAQTAEAARLIGAEFVQSKK